MEIEQKVFNWYSRESVQKILLEAGKDREVVSVYKDGQFGKRPNVLQFTGDVTQEVANGALSFHYSVEHWSQPMKLAAGQTKPELDSLRQGWDIFIDPDVPDFEIAKITVRQILETLKDFGVRNPSIKFSGGKGFHIAMPFESMPEKINLQPTVLQYPDLLHRIIEFLKWYMKDQMKEALLELDSPQNISQRINKPLSDITDENGLLPFKVVTFDLFSSRHLVRMPYSLHEKNLLVSLPLKPENLEKFTKEMAQPEKVKVEESFLQTKNETHDAEPLVIEALDWASKYVVEVKTEPRKQFVQRKYTPIPEEMFPPCIKRILQGMTEGRKRSVFILINFLRNMNWSEEQIEKRMMEWNEKNYPPLRTNYIRSQLRWHFQQKDRTLLPPNCDNENFYKALGLHELCHDLHTQKIINPVNWPLRQLKTKSKKVTQGSARRSRQQSISS